jgi:hypothetical protein
VLDYISDSSHQKVAICTFCFENRSFYETHSLCKYEKAHKLKLTMKPTHKFELINFAIIVLLCEIFYID